MPARSTQVRNAVADRIVSGWPAEKPAAVESVYHYTVSEGFPSGRRVLVFDVGEEGVGAATRLADTNDYSVTVVVFEKFEEAGDPPTDWIDELVDWVASEVYGKLQNQRLPWQAPLLGNELWPQEAAIVLKCDADLLVSEHKLFWSVCEFTFREVR
jgi:hypothetical protein